jgi:hypothetical protein
MTAREVKKKQKKTMIHEPCSLLSQQLVKLEAPPL